MSLDPKYSGIRRICTSFVVAVLLGACFEADPRTLQGALDYAMRALEEGDGQKLYKVIDQRARHALISIVKDRQRARALIETDYPQGARAAALQSLGDAGQAKSADELFAMRCGAPCMERLLAQLGAPVSQRMQGEETVVTTSRGTTLHMYAGKDTWYGLVWHTAELGQERNRASRDLKQIQANAQVYRRRRALDSSSGQAPVAK